ncbi:unnamed protein product [Aphanomyces euteiches]
MDEVDIAAEDLATCIRVLESFHSNLEAFKAPRFKSLRRAVLPLCEDVRSRLFHGKDVATYEQSKQIKQERKRKAAQAAALDKQFINNTKLRVERLNALDSLTTAAPMLPQIPDGAVIADLVPEEEQEAPTLNGFRSCYVCKKRFDVLHHFYDQLCPTCAALNFEKRLQTTDLTGCKALVTGARVKIGYHTALKLLRAGAIVIATSRFPQDAAIRYSKESDYDKWKHLLANERRANEDIPAAIRDVLRGNSSFQQSLTTSQNHLALTHSEDPLTLSKPATTSKSAEMSQLPLTKDDQELAESERAALYPTEQYDTNMQQVDLRKTNSWKLKIDQVESPELAEVFAINTLAPFILNKRAILLFEKSDKPYKFIVNVSAMEGKFYRYKTPHHPHTNMAKAAVNMMTRTCAEELKSRKIFMNSVDTGWINDENPREKAQAIAVEHNFQTPLDEIDAAARILDPIFGGFQLDPVSFPAGEFFKDYQRSEW